VTACPEPPAIHDFAGLAERTGAGDRWLALGGPSGSGKSTYARWLLDTHPGWQGPAHVLCARPLDLGVADPLEPRIVVVDEVVTLWQLAGVVRLLGRGHRLIVCTHLPAMAFLPLRALFRGRFVSTAVAGEAKVARELARRGLRYSEAAVRAYVRWFGPVYTEIDIVLERCPGEDFDRSLRWFAKFHRLDVRPA